MAIGERIRFFRNLRGMTLKVLGTAVGFSPRTAEVRMSQYEKGLRTPKADLTEHLAHLLQVSPDALNVPDIDTYQGFMHTLFAIEDLYGLQIGKLDGELCLHFNSIDARLKFRDDFNAWYTVLRRYQLGEISKEEYDRWRYTFPEVKARETRDRLDALRQNMADSKE
ncbi:transcriptional regulator [Flavonifractor sp. An112]|uniref:helix-turn-helix domain-containing protein n=1 Tax=Flavonifractor sp. An112 TaxID=1965544 RepID=UPI000B37B3E1|nr:helix-turn-helix transcriptional regulator [Flavonifractor sp. An112]OUQ55805.1 transcriptional regulator [Flavonifractor sp. An112]